MHSLCHKGFLAIQASFLFLVMEVPTRVMNMPAISGKQIFSAGSICHLNFCFLAPTQSENHSITHSIGYGAIDAY
jgi:hypothetical protein